MKNRILILFSFLFFTLLMQAQIKVASILGDNMVLQRNSEVKIWGTSGAKDKLIISASWDKSKITATANDKGQWLAKVKTTEAGGPYTITISKAKQKVEVKNINSFKLRNSITKRWNVFIAAIRQTIGY